jgi:NodT family efflux transporter outer membrane factor (OMF) lipoprotein
VLLRPCASKRFDPSPTAGARPRLLPAALLGVLAGLSGCAVGPNYHEPKPDMPPKYAAAAAGSSTATTDRGSGEAKLAAWWRTLNDSELDSLVDRAIKSNLDLQIALVRLQQARTYEAVIVGHALPEVDATAAEGRGTGSDLSRGRADQSLRSADNSTGLQHLNTLAGFDAVWEIDIFGKYRRAFQAARFDAQAAAAARYNVITAIAADVVRAYVDLRGYQVQVSVLRQAHDALQESLRIVNIRYERGITNELDVALATRELNTLDALIAPEEAQASAAEYTLAVLLGEYPENIVQELKTPDVIPAMPGPLAAGAPIDLLRRRPDIQQAERQRGAATARIGVATADLFPQVALIGSIGAQQGQSSQPGQIGTTTGQHIWSFGPGAVWPLLDFGALDAEVDIADLEARAALANYRKTILDAVQEVDSAIDAYSAQQSRLHDLGLALLAGQRAVELATQRYNRGLTDFLNVVDAERQYYDIQGQYVSAQIAEGEQFVQLYRSLGGGWQDYQKVPDIRQPQPAIVAAFRRLLSSGSP